MAFVNFNGIQRYFGQRWIALYPQYLIFHSKKLFGRLNGFQVPMFIIFCLYLFHSISIDFPRIAMGSLLTYPLFIQTEFMKSSIRLACSQLMKTKNRILIAGRKIAKISNIENVLELFVWTLKWKEKWMRSVNFPRQLEVSHHWYDNNAQWLCKSLTNNNYYYYAIKFEISINRRGTNFGNMCNV